MATYTLGGYSWGYDAADNPTGFSTTTVQVVGTDNLQILFDPFADQSANPMNDVDIVDAVGRTYSVELGDADPDNIEAIVGTITWGGGQTTQILDLYDYVNDVEYVFYLSGATLPALSSVQDLINFSDTMTGMSTNMGSTFSLNSAFSIASIPGTIVTHDDTLYGTADNDIYYIGQGNDLVLAGEGNDTVYGSDGNDILWGQNGADLLNGGNDSDRLHGGNGDDILIGGAGQDKLYGGNWSDRLWGGDDRDILYGEAGNDRLYGSHGDDILIGGDGQDQLYGGIWSDRLWGGNHNDTLDGGAGNDRLAGGSGNDVHTGGAGADLFIFASNGGIDRVTDYAQGEDQIRIEGHSGGFGGLTITNYNGNKIVFYDGGRIVLEGDAGLTLTVDDFVFG
ncbi:calcium-binding protein [Aliiroseovarius crassostreae]|uniref:calcium-binding protein n=1 Tax=Aliiroseovarius crassostreae TaxID=154981 RepID=UPI00220B3E00|nr:calcium-binding protein [Aliiroseovarius crassostreae]UWQ06604.1 hypothetical protein K3X22_15040 [Aliiroseovarius crassostreae]